MIRCNNEPQVRPFPHHAYAGASDTGASRKWKGDADLSLRGRRRRRWTAAHVIRLNYKDGLVVSELEFLGGHGLRNGPMLSTRAAGDATKERETATPVDRQSPASNPPFIIDRYTNGAHDPAHTISLDFNKTVYDAIFAQPAAYQKNSHQNDFKHDPVVPTNQSVLRPVRRLAKKSLHLTNRRP